jgi:hypothetical protein
MNPRGHTIADLDAKTSVLLVLDSELDKRSVFLECINSSADSEITIVLATAASGEELISEFDDYESTEDQFEVIDGTIQPEGDEESPSDVKFMPPVSDYLSDLGSEFNSTLDELETEIDRNQSALQNTVGFYSLGPLLEYGDDPEPVFRFCCILLSQIEDAGGRAVFVIENSYTTNINRLEVLFDKRVDLEITPNGERTRTLSTTV